MVFVLRNCKDSKVSSVMASKNTRDRDTATTVPLKGGGVREELVGKRFLLVQGGPKPKITRVQEWSWKAGIIRCASHVDCNDHDLQVQMNLNEILFMVSDI